uniref:Uncharacterized protein n=1 Tax=Oreochromis niloticus TaxID=8128 RepID=A0A669DV46_ORENI
SNPEIYCLFFSGAVCPNLHFSLFLVTELLTDNVRVAIECAQAVVRERQGGTWNNQCENRDLSSYLDGCEIPCIPN